MVEWLAPNAISLIKLMNIPLEGDVIYMNALGKPFVVLNNIKHAQELMEKQGSVYSDRPRMVVKLRSVTLLPYGDLWRLQRRLLQQYLNPRAVTCLRPLQIDGVRSLLHDLLGKPQDFWAQIKMYSASTILSVAYGHHVKSEDDPLTKLIEKSRPVVFGPGAPGTTLVDLCPILRFLPSFLPGFRYKRLAAQGRDALQEVVEQPFDMVKKQRAVGNVTNPSLVSLMLDYYDQKGMDDESYLRSIKEVAGTLYRAGVGTTTGVLHTFVLAMVLNPKIAKKAQFELDYVTGGERLPLFEDRDSLPYIDCIFKECLRWVPPFPLGIPHRAMQDGKINGKHVPKGSLIIPNIWHMMHDECNYTDPYKFFPERFMKTDDKTHRVIDPASAVFGFGRRICPGRHFAEASIWLAIANILAVFDISPALDDNGREISPEANKFTRGATGSVEVRMVSTSTLPSAGLTEIPKACKVLVVGGGPGGSYAAAALAREDLDVVLLEADLFPSLLPALRYLLKFIDLDSTFESHGFSKKVGAAFKLNRRNREGYTDFLASYGKDNYAWNVMRSEADDLFFKHAGKCGAKIFDGVKVSAIFFEGDGNPSLARPVRASYVRKSDSSTGEITFDYIIDASGRAGLINTRYLKNRTYNQGLKNVAWWGYWKDAKAYGSGTPRENAPFFEALTDESGWAWTIPLREATSVGLVMNQDIANKKKQAQTPVPSAQEFYLEQLKLAPNLYSLICSGGLIGAPDGGSTVKSASDYSYSSSFYAAPGFRVVGDAGAFIDPFFSSGVHLALTGALSAAATICAAIRGDCSEEEAANWHSNKVGASYTWFLMVVLGAYKQMRSQEEPILSDVDEDNFDRAFDFLKPGAF
ncbi:hypothetical protein EW145_g6055 [Phellinidium pouzarii]|uniref:FAD/NAD(P)-binding domain-containing protein n=1 Tax=Phellinidium pouzarii TaxID=167371 RepID=A0A4S4KXZ7_9AGAM|nr:hypothetical protein EW145_g6055 [Phellinidium pouzarii]